MSTSSDTIHSTPTRGFYAVRSALQSGEGSRNHNRWPARETRNLLIRYPGGKMETAMLTGERVVVGRSCFAKLCFSEDTALSREHCAFELSGDDWSVRDLGSRNGTFVNDAPVREPLVLKPGDSIAAGQVVMVYAPEAKAPGPGAAVLESAELPAPIHDTVVTNLEQVLSEQTLVLKSGPLEALMRAGHELSENRSLDDLFPAILDLALLAVSAQRGVLLVLEGNTLVPKACQGEYFPISSAVRDRVLNEKTSVLVRDARLDDAFKNRMSIIQQRVHTILAVPLQTRDRILGLIYVDSSLVLREFTEDDLSLLTVMANIAAIRIENARLAAIEQAQRRLLGEIEQAAEIQRRFLPEGAPEVSGVDLAGFNLPCHTVGGDYYDFFRYPEGRIALALGDVSGKGMPAALMMMALCERMRVLTEDPGDLGGFMMRLNKATCIKCPKNRFITFFFCALDTASGELRTANAGHNPPIILRASGDIHRIEGAGLVLGIQPNEPYREQRTHLGAGDLLVLYSDGVTEARNAAEQEFGEERLIAVLKRHSHEPAQAIIDAVMDSLTRFAAGAPLNDDVTLVVAKR
jgi:sigma-B regulation protein RsbU (phosphoserine phosphatase)